ARIEAVAHALWSRGVVAGDRVALMSPNRIDWVVVNLAVLSIGAATVPLYATQALDHVQIILDDCGAKLLFVDSEATRSRLREGGVRAPETVVFDGSASDGLAAFEAAGAALRDASPSRLADYAGSIKPEDLAVLIYTSGTTGVPKGVMLTHRNIASTALAGLSTLQEIIRTGEPVLSVLPWAHIYEHTDLYLFFLCNATVYVCHGPDDLLADLQAVRPVVFAAVPRIFERVIAGIIGKSKAEGGLKARLVPWALGVGRQYMRATLENGAAVPGTLRLQYALAKALVLKKLRPALGLDRLKFVLSGSAPLHEDVALTLAAADITILEGYGLTECSPVVSVNTPEHYRLGTVGMPIAGVDVRLADDGELLVRGPNVMKGYYHDPAATAATIHDGWLATGDIASIDADGFIRITDRKKELFKTSGGKFVAPARVESALLRSPYVSQVMVLGNGRAHPIALVSPNWPLVRRDLGIADDVSPEQAAELVKVQDFMSKEAATNSADLATYEQVRRVGVLPRDLTIADNELSPTLKVRRRVVEERYADLIEQAYGARSTAEVVPA
ncbi:MAG: long-chain fatty acid--CoA ligase, partial [Actinobacteria bacterium]|nr:long-chain fatty acid--CoA ligase [Actinomycetota bacterium]